MQITSPHELPRLLGRNTYIVYSLLCFAELEQLAPVGRQWLIDNMPGPASPNTVTQALHQLTSPECQYAVRVRGGWRLARDAFQLPLEYLLPAKDPESTKDSQNPLYSESPKDSPRASAAAAGNSGPALPTITTSTTTRGEKDSESPKDSDDTKYPQSTNSARFRACIEALREYEVLGRKARELAQLEWVTPEYIRAHMQHAEEEQDRWESPVGMAVYRIQGHAPVPKERGRSRDEEDRRKYIRGPYAEFIEH